MAHVQELVVGASSTPLQDDNVSMISTTSSTSAFAGGDRGIDVCLRDTRVIIDAEMRAWRAKRRVFGDKTQMEIEAMDDEDATTAAEDCDQMRTAVGNCIRAWVMYAVDNLDMVDAHDRHIRFRVAKYVNRKRATFRNYGFLMEVDAKDNIDMQKSGIFPSEDFIMGQCRTKDSHPTPTATQDELQLGADASSLIPPILPNQTTHLTSLADQRHARREALAEQMAKEREDHEKRMAAERRQIAAMKHQIQKNEEKRRQLQMQKEEEALKAAREEERRLEEENERQPHQALLESRIQQQQTPANTDMEHQLRRLNNLVDGDVTIAISEESTMRRKMMALQRAQESRPAKKFNNGDSLAFRSLMSRFDAAVGDDALDDASRLFELFHWFEGSAAAMIDSFASLPDAKHAYRSARAELKNVFGASSDSVVPLIRELLAGNAVKEDDHQAYLLLYSQLVTADTTATSLGQRNLLDRFDYCAEIIEKRLPHLAERWWRKDHEHQMSTGSRFAFSHLKGFVMVATKICASRQNLKRASVFNCNSQDPQPTRPQPEKWVQQKQPTDVCQECGQDHETEQCPILLAMPMDERSQRIAQRHWCYRCLLPNHERRQCKSDVECGVCGSKTHNTLFHGRNVNKQQQHVTAPTSATEDSSPSTPSSAPLQ